SPAWRSALSGGRWSGDVSLLTHEPGSVNSTDAMDANENKRLVWPDVPPLDELPAAPRRTILHWTAGTYQAGNLEREHYHYLIEGDGKPVEGVPVALNMRDVSQGGR